MHKMWKQWLIMFFVFLNLSGTFCIPSRYMINQNHKVNKFQKSPNRSPVFQFN